MNDKILVTGASGFLGSAIVKLALERGLAVKGMVRESSSLELLEDVLEHQNFELIKLDMSAPDGLKNATEGCSAVIHCAATTSQSAPDFELSRKVNVEGTKILIKSMQAHSIRRLINISSQSAQEENPSAYGRTKWEQDQVVIASSEIDWTILKPSIIYGPQPKGIFDKMVGLCKKLPVIPIIGNGTETMSPVHVDDVASAALDCIQHESTISKTYDIGGPEKLLMKDFYEEILISIGLKKMKLRLPIPIAMLLAKTLSMISKNPPLTPDNVKGIQMAPEVDISAAINDFNFSPRTFREGLKN